MFAVRSQQSAVGCLIFRSSDNQKKTKKEEEERKRAETMHKEQMKMLSGLTNILGKLPDAKK